MAKTILKHIVAFLVTLVALAGILVLSSLVPKESIRDNLIESMEHYRNKQPFQSDESGRLNKITDNYADVILLGVLWNVSSDEPFVSAIDTKYFDGNTGSEDLGESWGLYTSLTNGEEPNTDYTRYWHGMMVILRPMLTFATVPQIKAILLALVLLLGGACCVILAVKKQYFAAGAFVLSACCVHIWNIRLSLEYIPAFLVAFAMCIPFILLEKKGDGYLTILSVISGVAINFFDFLTAETLSILLPLVLVFIMREQENRLGELKKNIILTIECGAAWGISYAMTFVSKWTLATVVTGENKFAAAFSSVGERTFGEMGQGVSYVNQLLFAPAANISTLFGGKERLDVSALVTGIIVTAILLGGVFIAFGKTSGIRRDFIKLMLVTAALPYVRFFVLSNHSYLHEFFTYRAQMVVALALFAIVWFNVEFVKKAPVKKKKAVKK